MSRTHDGAYNVYVVVRWDGFPENRIPDEWKDRVVVIKGVFECEGAAQREVDRLNGLGRAHYFYQPAPFISQNVL